MNERLVRDVMAIFEPYTVDVDRSVTSQHQERIPANN